MMQSHGRPQIAVFSLLLLQLFWFKTSGFTTCPSGRRVSTATFLARYRPDSNKPPPPPKKNGDFSLSGSESERNWIEKSSPTGTDSDVDEYTLKLHGPTFQVGPLSLRIYNALMENAAKRFQGDKIPPELIPVYKAYAMDMTCREATKAALKHNRLKMVESAANAEGASMPGEWGNVEHVEILSSSQTTQTDDNIIPEDLEIVATLESIQEAVSSEKWSPGQAFNFVVRNVKAKLPELTLKDLMKTLNMQDMAKEMGVDIDDMDIEIGEDDDDEDDEDEDNDVQAEISSQDLSKVNYTPMEVNSLAELRQDCENRCNAVPISAAAIGFAGGSERGYDILTLEKVQADWTRLFNAWEKHGFAIIDLGSDTPEEQKLAKMWKVAENFFSTITTNKDMEAAVPKMEAVDDGSQNSVVGYASYDNGAMLFLETRLLRKQNDEELLPKEVATIIGYDGVECIKSAQRVLIDVGREVARVAVASCLIEEAKKGDDKEKELTPSLSGIALGMDSPLAPNNEEKAFASATLIIDSLMDHGRSTGEELASEVVKADAEISSSPHRLCRYEDNGKNPSASATEVFGAHTDTTFVTVIPVAAVSGLEIFDNAAGAWIRPELMARRHWENERMEQNKIPSAIVGENGQPWHARYVVCMPGELLELVTQRQILTAVHRVVAACFGEARISAPVLLRARPKALMDLKKLYGSNDANVVGSLLATCDHMTMEEIHNCLQPSPTV